MNLLFRLSLGIALYAGLAGVQAQPLTETEHYYALILDYVAKIENIYNDNWAYTYTIDDKLAQESRTIRRDISLPFLQREQLLAINDMPPSEERLIEHQKDRESALLRREERRQERQNQEAIEHDDRDQRDEKQRFIDMLLNDSVHLIRHDGHLLYLGFRAMEEGREKIFENIEGMLIIDTQAEYIMELQVRVIEPFAPFFLSRVEDGFFSLRFEMIEGVPMQSEITWRLEGRAFFIRNLDADREIVWQDIQPINPDFSDNFPADLLRGQN
jgi:hypothetical protein